MSDLVIAPVESPATILRPRFVGADAWARLRDDERATIGAVALELVAAMNGLDLCEAMGEREAARPWEAAERLLRNRLRNVGARRLVALSREGLAGLPSLLGPVCRRCGCSHEDPCFPPCSWAEPDLCTACIEPPPAESVEGSGEPAPRIACPKCRGDGRVANTDEQEPWSAWENLPLKAAAAVIAGIVRPIACPSCGGLGEVAAPRARAEAEG